MKKVATAPARSWRIGDPTPTTWDIAVEAFDHIAKTVDLYYAERDRLSDLHRELEGRIQAGTIIEGGEEWNSLTGGAALFQLSSEASENGELGAQLEFEDLEKMSLLRDELSRAGK